MWPLDNTVQIFRVQEKPQCSLRELTQSVGSVTFAKIPCSTNESSSFFKGSLRASGTLRGGAQLGERQDQL